MGFPLDLAFAPMEATSATAIPIGSEWQYEPKWDGFRCLAFRDGEMVALQSKSGQPLGRYFPEVVAFLARLKTKRFVLDGEIVIPDGSALSFNALLQRIHPAASRVQRLAVETPAWLIAFDLLAEGSVSLVAQPLRERRAQLEAFAAKNFAAGGSLRLSPATTKLAAARKWLDQVGGSLDGVIAKRLDVPYASGTRDGMVKIKAHRTADCVVGGFRYASKGRVVGSLLLGLYDADGLLHHVGFCSGLKADELAALTARLEKQIGGPGFTGRAPGGPSRWNTAKSTDWQPLKPGLVVEVSFDHVTADRFRHGTRLLRWRPDKSPQQCTMDQVHQKPSRALALLDGRGRPVSRLKKPTLKPTAGGF